MSGAVERCERPAAPNQYHAEVTRAALASVQCISLYPLCRSVLMPAPKDPIKYAEFCRKIGDAFRGKKLSDERRAQIAASVRGRVVSEETKAKIGAKARARSIENVRRDLFARVNKDANGCWLWTGAMRADGYGVLRSRPAHRVSYEVFVGPIADDMVICHRCDVRNCVNPEHLFQGTQRENILDASSKGRLCSGDAHHMRDPQMVERVAAKQRGVPVPGRGKPGWIASDETRRRMSESAKRRGIVRGPGGRIVSTR